MNLRSDATAATSDLAETARPQGVVDRGPIIRHALALGLGSLVFGISFGTACAMANISTFEALAFSVIVSTGSAQLAAVTVLASGGMIGAAVVAGGLLNLRYVAYGVALTPVFNRALWWRALTSQLMGDEAAAVGLAQEDVNSQRYGYCAGGLAHFAGLVTGTWIGVGLLTNADDLIFRSGLDATIPAAFLTFLWPRLSDPLHRTAAAVGAISAIVLTPLAPAGVPIIAAGIAGYYVAQHSETSAA